MPRYTFRIRKVGDHRDWRDIQPETVTESEENAQRRARTLTTRFRDIVEVRYNVEGSQQGHYVTGSDENRNRHREAVSLNDYVFIVRLVGDYRKWKDIVFRVSQSDITAKSADHYAELLTRRHKNVVEVRYNIVGSPIKHNVVGSEKNRRQHAATKPNV